MGQHLRAVAVFTISLIVISIWHYFFPYQNGTHKPINIQQEELLATRNNKKNHQNNKDKIATSQKKLLKKSKHVVVSEPEIVAAINRDITDGTRIKLSNKDIDGSINLIGGVIDDIKLSHYKQTISTDSSSVMVLSPRNSIHPFFITFHWLCNKNVAACRDIELPNINTMWTAMAAKKTTEIQITNPGTHRVNNGSDDSILSWTNNKGIQFIMHVSYDDGYMIKVMHEIVAPHSIIEDIKSANIRIIGSIERTHDKKTRGNVMVHDGAIAVADGKLHEDSYADINKKHNINYSVTDDKVGWTGFVDRYWLVSLIFDNTPASVLTKSNNSLNNMSGKPNDMPSKLDSTSKSESKNVSKANMPKISQYGIKLSSWPIKNTDVRNNNSKINDNFRYRAVVIPHHTKKTFKQTNQINKFNSTHISKTNTTNTLRFNNNPNNVTDDIVANTNSATTNANTITGVGGVTININNPNISTIQSNTVASNSLATQPTSSSLTTQPNISKTASNIITIPIQSFSVFVGPKDQDILNHYGDKYNIQLFDRAIDFGMLYFITKPILFILNYFHYLIGNFGVAIILLTIIIKTALLPLTYASVKNMTRFKALQPKITAIKATYINDMHGAHQAIAKLYKKEKLNPFASIIPILLQLPIFFALYKVLCVTTEMRHAPFLWWIKDLAAPDPTSIFTLFGLIHLDLPSFLQIGILPALVAFTMYIQQKFNKSSIPTSASTTSEIANIQAKIMRLLPIVFMFMFSSFPSGLLLYWTCSNILSIIQQQWITNKINKTGHKIVQTTSKIRYVETDTRQKQIY